MCVHLRVLLIVQDDHFRLHRRRAQPQVLTMAHGPGRLFPVAGTRRHVGAAGHPVRDDRWHQDGVSGLHLKRFLARDDLCQRGPRRVEPGTRPAGAPLLDRAVGLSGRATRAGSAPTDDAGHRPEQERRTPSNSFLSEALTRSRASHTFNASYSVRHI